MEQMRRPEKKLDLELTNMKRNPYLVDYTEYKQAREHRAVGIAQGRTDTVGRAGAARQRAVRSESARQRVVRSEPARQKPARSNRVQIAQRRRKMLFYRKAALAAGLAFVIILLSALAVSSWWKEKQEAQKANAGAEQDGANNLLFDDLEGKTVQGLPTKIFGKHPTWTEDFLTVNEYSRPGDELKEVNSIFVHYTANPGTSAKQNRSYFEQLKDTHERSASAHFIIGYDGEIIQCIPLNEIAYAVQTRNEDSISIECCYLEKDGSFTQETYDSLILLLGWLRDAYGLEKDDILRHYDCGGKKCPLYYTENADAWEQLRKDVK